MKKSTQYTNKAIDRMREKWRAHEAYYDNQPTIREQIEAKHGSVAKGFLHVGVQILIGIGTIFAAFIAAILNLARKS